jgi:hypothetical protein
VPEEDALGNALGMLGGLGETAGGDAPAVAPQITVGAMPALTAAHDEEGMGGGEAAPGTGICPPAPVPPAGQAEPPQEVATAVQVEPVQFVCPGICPAPSQPMTTNAKKPTKIYGAITLFMPFSLRNGRPWASLSIRTRVQGRGLQ